MTVGTFSPMGHERRAHARYPVKLALRFLIRTEKVLSISGEGTSLNISSTGMLFRCSERLTSGDTVTAALEWPQPADGKPMILLVHGHVVWIKSAQVGLSVSHYGFLAQNIPAADDLESLNKLALPRHLTPTKANASLYPSVRQWKKSVGQWK